MQLAATQSLSLGMQQKLSPRLIQSMAILQMPLAELEERIEQELESNPTLELIEREGKATRDAEDRGPLEVGTASATDDFSRLDSFESANPEAAENEYDASDAARDAGDRDRASEYESGSYASSRLAGERDAKMDAMASAPARSVPLAEQLRGQWGLADVAPDLRPLGEWLLRFVEDDGYLRTPLEVIAERAMVGSTGSTGSTGAAGDARGSDGPAPDAVEGPTFTERPTVDRLEQALRALQLFLEPAGVCARDARECLLLQLDSMEEDAADLGWPPSAIEHARTLVRSHLEDLGQNRLPRIAEKSGLTLTEIKEALTLLRRLSVAPAKRLVDDAVRPIMPDATVEYDEMADRYVVTLNDRHLRRLRINEEYERLTRGKELDKQGKEFVRTNLGNARWLIDAVGQRRATLQRVIERVVSAQRDFFDFGPSALKPLPMTQVAEEIGVHVATVSRAVAEKWIATPRGTFPLRRFFSGGVQTKAVAAGADATTQPGSVGGEQLAWDAIKEAMREVVEAEDKDRPMSDEAIAAELKGRGIEIARRTVAKYREQLGIPSARMRKKY